MIKTSDIVNKVFSKAFMGYDVREVDAFLDDLIDELDRLNADRRELAGALETLMREIERLGGARPVIGVGKNVLDKPQSRGIKAPEKPPASEESAAKRRTQAVRIGTAARQMDKPETVAEVALEMETGAAAPKRKVAEAELMRAAAMEEHTFAGRQEGEAGGQ